MNLSPEVSDFIQNLTLSQDSKDRYNYKKIATEAINGAGSNRGKLVELLYRDVLSKQDLDFGEIPDSKGNITKFKYYENIERCIESLSKLLDASKVKELQLTIDLRNMIVAERENFEYGFKFGIDLIQVTYNTLVMTLMELINICIYAYVDYLKDTKNIEFDFKVFKKNSLVVIKAANQVVNSYKKGDWSKMMLQFKKATKGAALESVTTIAEEGIIKKTKSLFLKMKEKIDDKTCVTDEVKKDITSFYLKIAPEVKKIIEENLIKITNDEAKQRLTSVSIDVTAKQGSGKKGGWKDIELELTFSNITNEEYRKLYDFNECEFKEEWAKQYSRIGTIIESEVSNYLINTYGKEVFCMFTSNKIVVYIKPKYYSKFIETPSEESFMFCEDDSESLATEALGTVTQLVGKEIFKNVLSTAQKKFLKKVLIGVGVTGLAIVSVIAGVAAIRELVYYFYSANYKINDFIKIENDFLQEALKNEQLDAKATARITRMSSVLTSISGFIETKILKTNNAAQKNLAVSDKEIYSKENLMSDVSDLDTEESPVSIDDNTSQRLAQQNISF